jgi:trans-aconitate methyltransferase
MLQRMTPKDYSEFWERESSQFDSDKIYARISEMVPAEATLEVGCGAGWSTLSLAVSRPVLAIDNNPHLIERARARLRTHGATAEIVQSDLFEPSDELLSRLLKYTPTEEAFLRLRGSRRKVYRIVQFQRQCHACSAV